MINQIITNIKQDLSQILTPDQMEALSQSLNKHLPMLAGDKSVEENTKHDMLPLFIAAKAALKSLSDIMNQRFAICWRPSISLNARSALKIYEAISIHTSVEALSARLLWIT